jgi:hypothetical protein
MWGDAAPNAALAVVAGITLDKFSSVSHARGGKNTPNQGLSSVISPNRQGSRSLQIWCQCGGYDLVGAARSGDSIDLLGSRAESLPGLKGLLPEWRCFLIGNFGLHIANGLGFDHGLFLFGVE